MNEMTRPLVTWTVESTLNIAALAWMPHLKGRPDKLRRVATNTAPILGALHHRGKACIQ